MKSLFISLDVYFPVPHYKVINFLLWGIPLVPAGCVSQPLSQCASYRQYILYTTILKSKILEFWKQLAPRFVIRYCGLWLFSWSATLRVCKRIKQDGMKWYHDFFQLLRNPNRRLKKFHQMYYMQLRSGLKIEKRSVTLGKKPLKGIHQQVRRNYALPDNFST